MLMHADNGSVDHLDSGIMSSGKRVHDAAPDTRPPPADEPVVATGAWAKHLAKVLLQDPEDVVEDTTVINPRNPTRLFRQHGLDGGPFIIGEFVRHDSSPQFGKFESQGFGQTQRFWPGPPRRLWAEADINKPTIRVETVENDPKPTLSSRMDGIARAMKDSVLRVQGRFGALHHPPPSLACRPAHK